MIPLSPQLLIATAVAMAGVRVPGKRVFGPGRLPGTNSTAPSENPGQLSWDSRFIQECGYWSHYNCLTKVSSWPIPRGLNTMEMWSFGLAHGILRRSPLPGDIFLQYAPQRKEYSHVGIVAHVLNAEYGLNASGAHELYCIEGDTDSHGRLQRGRIMRVRRRLVPALRDRYLRWADLEAQAATMVREQAREMKLSRRTA